MLTGVVLVSGSTAPGHSAVAKSDNSRMKREEFLALLEELIEAPKGTLKSSETLESLENWNSLAVVSFMAMADEHYGVTLGAKQIADCKTVGDLLNLVGVPAV